MSKYTNTKIKIQKPVGKKKQVTRVTEKVDNLIVLKQVKFQRARWTKLYINFNALV